MKKKVVLTLALFIASVFGVNQMRAADLVQDVHSYSNPNKIYLTNVDLDWTVDFDKRSIRGTATLDIKRTKNAGNAPLILDTKTLEISRVEASSDNGKTFQNVHYEVGKEDKIFGAPLVIKLPKNATKVRITYSTAPAASGLQWLTPEQTAGKKMPFMFSQGQAILARSYVPLQDSPQVRVTYTAKVHTPKGLLAVMSAEGNSQTDARDGEYQFKMTKPIPSYLITIAVGDIRFKPTGTRTGIYAEPSMVEKAAKEFEDTEKMIVATERLYGKYRWGRYDLIVLPPSFPFGGMENPMLTFATPTVIAGDKSLVSLVAHELAHSWSGNLVTNATWRDFWLNEGFTTYLTYRITEAVYGEEPYKMEAVLGKNGLIAELKETNEPDQILHVNLDGRDPDEGFTGIPYEKGAQFLRFLEERFGRATFDKFLNGYFNSHAFRSIKTSDFVDYLNRNLLSKKPGVVSAEEINEWIEKPGLPSSAPAVTSEALSKPDIVAKQFTEGYPAASLDTRNWVTQQWLRFLIDLPADISIEKMKELDKTFGFTETGNSEILFQWLMTSIKRGYAPADQALNNFLTTVGRRKFVKPLYEELAKTPEGKARAIEIYKKARAGYHPVTSNSIDQVLAK